MMVLDAGRIRHEKDATRGGNGPRILKDCGPGLLAE